MSEPSEKPVIFQPLDRSAVIEITERNLPHWFQVGAVLFVTFRLADSLPRQVVLRMAEELREWLRVRSLPLSLVESLLGSVRFDFEPVLDRLEHSHRRELRKMTNQLIHRSLDHCHGSCLLKNPALAEIVADSIKQFDGEKYDLDSLVVMPNHVHVIVQFRQENGLQTIGQSWMRYTARRINERLGRRGVLWQPEPFDHAIRSSEQFEHFQRYIVDNPIKAKLAQGEFLYWKRT
jgi:putative transposase